ncbi:MAG: FHA domain-containing protein [Deltaproteobacteria bacterium]|nr:FHA domain-containing protein [Deltaproteobacteria bacterium]
MADKAPQTLKLKAELGGTIYRVKRGALHLVGRQEGASIRLTGPVDRKNAELDFRGEHCMLNDPGSVSGLYLNGRAVRAPVALKAGDQIRVGGVMLVVLGYE